MLLGDQGCENTRGDDPTTAAQLPPRRATVPQQAAEQGAHAREHSDIGCHHGCIRGDWGLLSAPASCEPACPLAHGSWGFHLALTPASCLLPLQHFVCAKCEKPFLGHRHYEKKGLAYCETHYNQVGAGWVLRRELGWAAVCAKHCGLAQDPRMWAALSTWESHRKNVPFGQDL